MLGRMISACSVVLLFALPAMAAEECQSLGYDGRVEQLRKEPTCDRAMQRFGDCAYGASGDIGLTDVIIEKCEAGFAQKLSTSQRKAYDRGMKRCTDKYKNEDGSMYRAMEAGCRAELAQDYARKFGKR